MKLKEVRAKWDALQSNSSSLRSREAATAIGCSEAELVASGCGSQQVLALDLAQLPKGLGELARMGSWLWLLRNEASVLEVDAPIELQSSEPKQLLFSGEKLSIEIDREAIDSAFYVETSKWLKRSIQLFDKAGEAILKIYLRDSRRTEAADQWAQALALEAIPSQLELTELATRFPVTTLHTETRSIPQQAYRQLLESARDLNCPVTIQAANNGGYLRVQAIPRTLKSIDSWFNILDPGLNLHLREEWISEAWSSRRGDQLDVNFGPTRNQPALTLSFPTNSPLSSILP
ncbi:MAG: hypothetical protein JJU20_01750 [Opitutales bacterium]|nr:hypothetical protein [Opitutales bacterium]